MKKEIQKGENIYNYSMIQPYIAWGYFFFQCPTGPNLWQGYFKVR
jgi:hypothetical protein